MFTRAGLDSVVVEVGSAEAAALMARVVGKGYRFSGNLEHRRIYIIQGRPYKGRGHNCVCQYGLALLPYEDRRFRRTREFAIFHRRRSGRLQSCRSGDEGCKPGHGRSELHVERITMIMGIIMTEDWKLYCAKSKWGGIIYRSLTK